MIKLQSRLLFSGLFLFSGFVSAESTDKKLAAIEKRVYFVENSFTLQDALRRLFERRDISDDERAKISVIRSKFDAYVSQIKNGGLSETDYLTSALLHENLWKQNGDVNELNASLKLYRSALVLNTANRVARISIINLYSAVGKTSEASDWARHFALNHASRALLENADAELYKWILSQILSADPMPEALKSKLLKAKNPGVSLAYYFLEVAKYANSEARFDEAWVNMLAARDYLAPEQLAKEFHRLTREVDDLYKKLLARRASPNTNQGTIYLVIPEKK